MHQCFQLGVGFDGELIFVIETGQQGGNRFSLVGENEIVVAGFTFFGMQIKAAPFRFIWIIRILGIMKIAIVRKVRIEIGEFGCVIILLIVAVLEYPDSESVGRVGIRVEIDPLVQFKDAADVGQRGLFSVDAVRSAGTVAFDDYAAKDGSLSSSSMIFILPVSLAASVLLPLCEVLSAPDSLPDG